MEEYTVRDSPGREAIRSPVRVPRMRGADSLTEHVPVQAEPDDGRRCDERRWAGRRRGVISTFDPRSTNFRAGLPCSIDVPYTRIRRVFRVRDWSVTRQRRNLVFAIRVGH